MLTSLKSEKMRKKVKREKEIEKGNYGNELEVLSRKMYV